jgi:SAM-dependent methyltransferase
VSWTRLSWPIHSHWILPKRTPEEFVAEGIEQAEAIPTRGVVLEYGCGVGRVLEHVEATRRIGVDVAAGFLEEAARRGIETILTDGIYIDLPDDSVDFVFSVMVFQHTNRAAHPVRLQELRRVLRPDGGAWLQFPESVEYYHNTSYTYTRAEVDGYAAIMGGSIVRGALAAYYDKSTDLREWILVV